MKFKKWRDCRMPGLGTELFYMNIIFCPMPLRTSSIVKHDCGAAVAVS